MYSINIIRFCLFAIYLTIVDKEYVMSVAFFVLTIFMAYLIYIFYAMGGKTDLFGKTHYPIRLNRKIRKIYAFSPFRKKSLKWTGML